MPKFYFQKRRFSLQKYKKISEKENLKLNPEFTAVLI